MELSVICPQCGLASVANRKRVGKLVTCPGCKGAFVLVAPNEPTWLTRIDGWVTSAWRRLMRFLTTPIHRPEKPNPRIDIAAIDEQERIRRANRPPPNPQLTWIIVLLAIIASPIILWYLGVFIIFLASLELLRNL